MKKKHKKKRKSLPWPGVRPEYQWLNQQYMAGGPTNPLAIPFDKSVSTSPEMTLAQKWVCNNCKFASSN
jgi:hypothetical protein